MDSLNPAVIAAVRFGTSTQRPTQSKPYCQLCYQKFNQILVRRYHCYYCTRSACSNCSEKGTDEDGGGEQKGEKIRKCEYCVVKIQNPQIDQFY